ncbi:type I-F CRISPR-associated protein Csy1 [Paraglaciecola agarilytica]|uniref:type I-F CRISPR-associated protein Csy1 n=1 Tax=Paraglaciecola chathamensis TaxID=368405 RepID=UPI001C08A262|nr:type I-F CRISPR-associated protein Csy1 [Paraglaciecola agarilytica]MBU3017923.1 type I-F CRISPR-associated protein Csy1 [Paraglaciecola agarilytica]
MDKTITAFFDERKAAWLKKNLKASMSEVEVRDKEQECETVFALKNWLPDAANRAKSRAMTSHPSKFTHPSTGVGPKNRKNFTYVTPIICNAGAESDGFLRTGNVKLANPIDSIGNAGELDVDEFLTLVMADGQNLIQHLEQDTELALSLFTLPNVDEAQNYVSLKQGFLAMTSAGSDVVTSSKIKQVFFPILNHPNENAVNSDSYHQLSILTASGMVFELRKRLDAMRFGDDIKFAREQKKNSQAHQGFSEIYNLTTIGYGGTKPQNISVLNNQNGGKAHLFMSAPPVLKNRNIHFPRTDFFAQTVNYFQCKHQFHQLHKLYSRDNNNMLIRAERDEYYQSVVDHIIEKMWQVRSVALEQYMPTASQLSSAQKTWLCQNDESKTLRETTDDWLDEIIKSVSTFVFHGYEKILGKKAIKFGYGEHKHMQQIVLQNKEAFR